MHFVIIFGPPAVGKMTVGHELAQRTGFKLFHNHMTIELVLNFFRHGQPQFGTLVNEFRRRIFEEVAASELPGLIFTYVWALDDPDDKVMIDSYTAIFARHSSPCYFVELEADQGERLSRNQSDFRLAHKPSKRDITHSKKNLLESDSRYKLNSTGDFFYPEQHLRINNTLLSPTTVADMVIDRFGFERMASSA